MLSFLLKYYRSILIAAVIFILTTIPGKNINTVPFLPIPVMDKIAHFFVFLILSLFLFADIKKNNAISLKKTVLIVFFVNLLYGLFIEAVQLFFIMYRSAEFLDVLSNVFGIITGCLLQLKFKIIRY